MSETNNKLEIKKLSKRFGEKILFENLSLTVDGPAVLWAPSGWGKTTLLRIHLMAQLRFGERAENLHSRM